MGQGALRAIRKDPWEVRNKASWEGHNHWHLCHPVYPLLVLTLGKPLNSEPSFGIRKMGIIVTSVWQMDSR